VSEKAPPKAVNLLLTIHESGPAGPENRATLWLTDMQSEMSIYLRLLAVCVCLLANN